MVTYIINDSDEVEADRYALEDGFFTFYDDSKDATQVYTIDKRRVLEIKQK